MSLQNYKEERELIRRSTEEYRGMRMKIEQVISKEHAASIQIRDNESRRLTTVSVNVVRGSLEIRVVKNNKEIVLMKNGEIRKHPFDHYKMNSIESELESALNLFRELRDDA